MHKDKNTKNISYKVIFDVETTGLNCHEEQIAQLSYVIINNEYNIKNAKNFYFSVDYMSDGARAVNGLDEDILNELSGGKKFKDFANEIYQDFINADVLIAHNLDFDLKFLEEEFERLNYNIDTFNRDKKYYCTMQSYTMFMQIPHFYYGFKYPRLDEVMEYLNIKNIDIEDKTKEVFECIGNSYHDSRFDVIATLFAYQSVKKIKLVSEVYSSFSSVEKHFKRIKIKYIQNDFNKNNPKYLEDAYNILLSNSDNNIKKSLKRLQKRIDDIVNTIEEEQRFISVRE